MKAREKDRWVRHYGLYQLANDPANIATDWPREWMCYQYPAEFQKLAVRLSLRILDGDDQC